MTCGRIDRERIVMLSLTLFALRRIKGAYRDRHDGYVAFRPRAEPYSGLLRRYYGRYTIDTAHHYRDIVYADRWNGRRAGTRC